MQITVQLFGAFRPLGEALTFNLNTGDTIAELRTAMQAQIEKQHPDFAQRNILSMSRFSDETAVLAEETTLQDQQTLAILPPVSGG